MKNTIYKILGYILAGIVLVISITSIVLANTDALKEREERLMLTNNNAYTAIRLQASACLELKAEKIKNNIAIQSEDCGLNAILSQAQQGF